MWRIRRGRPRRGPERVRVVDAEEVAPRAGRQAGRGGVEHAAHLAGRHRDVEERGRVAAERGHGGAGGIAGGDVIGVPVEAVFAEASPPRRAGVRRSPRGCPARERRLAARAACRRRDRAAPPRRGRAPAAARLELARARCRPGQSGQRPRPASPRDRHSSDTCAPRAAHQASRPPAASDSSSGWAKTASSERPPRSRAFAAHRPAARAAVPASAR